MGIAVFFGMIGVTFFGIFLTPLFYVVIQEFVAKHFMKEQRKPTLDSAQGLEVAHE